MSRRHEVGVGVLLVVATGLLGYMAIQVGAIRGTGPTIELDAVLPDAAGLSEGAVVAIAGVQVGRVTTLAVDHDHARAHLSVDASANVRTDVRIAVRARSVLGEKYLELRPQSKDAPLLASGATLIDSAGQVEIDEMVTEMGPLLRAIDPKAVEALGKALTDDPDRPARMLADVEKALHNVALASDELPALIQSTKSTLAEVESTATRARTTLDRAEATLDRVDKAADAVDPAKIERLVDDAGGAMADARQAARHADETLGRIDGAVADGRKMLAGWSELDWETLRRVAQESGVYVRLSPVDKRK